MFGHADQVPERQLENSILSAFGYRMEKNIQKQNADGLSQNFESAYIESPADDVNIVFGDKKTVDFFLDFDVGDSHTIALSQSRNIFAWGSNEFVCQKKKTFLLFPEKKTLTTIFSIFKKKNLKTGANWIEFYLFIC